jgi:hypothetical protein
MRTQMLGLVLLPLLVAAGLIAAPNVLWPDGTPSNTSIIWDVGSALCALMAIGLFIVLLVGPGELSKPARTIIVSESGIVVGRAPIVPWKGIDALRLVRPPDGFGRVALHRAA